MNTKIENPKRSSLSSEVIPSRIWRVGLVGAVVSVVANLIVLFVLTALLPVPQDFAPLQSVAIAIFTFIGTALAVVAFALVVRFSNRPIRTYLIIAAAALVLSIIPNLGLMANPSAAPIPGGSALGFGLLIIFHVVAAVVIVFMLIKFTTK